MPQIGAQEVLPWAPAWVSGYSPQFPFIKELVPQPSTLINTDFQRVRGCVCNGGTWGTGPRCYRRVGPSC